MREGEFFRARPRGTMVLRLRQGQNKNAQNFAGIGKFCAFFALLLALNYLENIARRLGWLSILAPAPDNLADYPKIFGHVPAYIKFNGGIGFFIDAF